MGAGAGGGGTRGNGRVRQQQTKHCRRWREGPSASGGEGGSKKHAGATWLGATPNISLVMVGQFSWDLLKVA